MGGGGRGRIGSTRVVDDGEVMPLGEGLRLTFMDAVAGALDPCKFLAVGLSLTSLAAPAADRLFLLIFNLI